MISVRTNASITQKKSPESNAMTEEYRIDLANGTRSDCTPSTKLMKRYVMINIPINALIVNPNIFQSSRIRGSAMLCQNSFLLDCTRNVCVTTLEFRSLLNK